MPYHYDTAPVTEAGERGFMGVAVPISVSLHPLNFVSSK